MERAFDATEEGLQEAEKFLFPHYTHGELFYSLRTEQHEPELKRGPASYFKTSEGVLWAFLGVVRAYKTERIGFKETLPYPLRVENGKLSCICVLKKEEKDVWIMIEAHTMHIDA